MQTVTTIGLDIAKSVFQVHGVDAASQVVIRRKLKRRYVLAFFQKLPPCLVGIEACASSHYWARELQALGHKVRLELVDSLKVLDPRRPIREADICTATKSQYLFDHLVGAREQRRRHFEAERLRGIPVDNEFVFRGRLHRQVGRLRSPENSINIVSCAPKRIDRIRSIEHEPTARDIDPEGINRW